MPPNTSIAKTARTLNKRRTILLFFCSNSITKGTIMLDTTNNIFNQSLPLPNYDHRHLDINIRCIKHTHSITWKTAFK